MSQGINNDDVMVCGQSDMIQNFHEACVTTIKSTFLLLLFFS